jgi:16S rRNA U516 pseudouridylate synthase RsuA-like enzyme
MSDKPDDVLEFIADQEAAGMLLVKENERLREQLIAATKSGEHWYQLWTERSAENEWLRAAVKAARGIALRPGLRAHDELRKALADLDDGQK